MNVHKDNTTERIDPALASRFLPSEKSLKSEAGALCRHCGAVISPDAGELAHRWRVCPACDRRLQSPSAAEPAGSSRERRALYVGALRRRIDAAVPAGFRHARLRGLPENLRRALLSRRREQGLLLWGGVGTGKTHAVAAIVRAAVLQTRGEIRVERAVYDRLILDLRDCFKPGATKSELDVLRPYLAADILWLDDLGASESLVGAATDFQVRTVQTLLDDRMEQARPTFVTTNLSPENVRRVFDERIASRLQTFKIVELRGVDRRIARTARTV